MALIQRGNGNRDRRVGGPSPAERAVLTNLYESTNGASWTNHGNWNGVVALNAHGTGVTCDAGQTTVTSINLSNNNLTGTLPTTSTI